MDYVYEALDHNGHPYIRKAKTVDELPSCDLRMKTLQRIATKLNLEKICYGVPLYSSLGLTKAEAKKSNIKYIMLRGCDMPLSILGSNC